METTASNIKAIILVGGHSSGTRFRPLSMNTPKPLFPIAGKPMIYHHVSALSKVPGMKEILIIGFYEASIFDRFLNEVQIEFPRLAIRYLREYKCLGTAGGVHHFRDEIRRGGVSNFFVMNADIASSFPLLDLFSAHIKNDGVATMLSTKVDPEIAKKFGCIATHPEKEEMVMHFVEKPESFISNMISCGVYVFSSKIFQFLSDALSNKRNTEMEEGTPLTTMMQSNRIEDDLIQFEKDVLPLLMPLKLLYTWTCIQGRDFWMQVKTGSATIRANRAYLQYFMTMSPRKLSFSHQAYTNGEEKNDPEEVKVELIKPVYIHPSALIHPTAKLGPNVSIGPRTVIGRGVRVRDSIILDNCEINHDSCILNSVIGWDSKVGSWARIEGASLQDSESLETTRKGFKLPSATIFGKDVRVADEVIIRNCIVLPHKELKESFQNEILMFASSSQISRSYYHDLHHRQEFHKSPKFQSRKPQLAKRRPNTFLHQETESFSIYLSCSDPEPLYCENVLVHLARATKRIENVIVISNRIRLNATYKSFCANNPGSSCNPLGTLGYASPSGLHQFSPNATLPPGIDLDYVYPAALIRQILPVNDSAVRNSDPDLVASFNSNINWWFSDDIGVNNNGEFGPTAPPTNSSLKSYDFEQVALHEILHGLGFISGWDSWNGDGSFYPSFFEYDNTGKFKGLGPPWIYDKYLSDAINGFWMRDYDSAIRKDILDSVKLDESRWNVIFSKTAGYQIANALGASGSPLQTPRGLWSWFADFDKMQLVSRYAILNTPSKYDSGSSVSHMDEKYYSGTTQYLMKPSGTKNVGLDGYIPCNRLGPLSESILGILRTMGYKTVI